MTKDDSRCALVIGIWSLVLLSCLSALCGSLIIQQNMSDVKKLKKAICEIGDRIYKRGFAAANDGNISVRLNENEVLCTPTMHCKGFLKPKDICLVDMEGNQIAGKKKRSSEVMLHLEIMKARPDVQSVVHCHPPHATRVRDRPRTDSAGGAAGGRSVSWAKCRSRRMKRPAAKSLPRRFCRLSRSRM